MREEQIDDGIVGQCGRGDSGFGSLGIVEQTVGLVRAVSVDEGSVLRAGEGLAHALGDVLLEIEVGVISEFLAQL